MSIHVRLLIVTFLESFATICLERGIYFFSRDRLHFGDAQNLALAVVWGATYLTGALQSHAVARRVGEKRLLQITILGQLLLHVTMAAAFENVWVLVAGFGMLGYANGMKWPLVESYLGAGLTPSQTAVAIGRFNISWAVTVPLALVAAGPIIESPFPQGLFLLPAAINVACLLLVGALASRPAHLPEGHPQRPEEHELARCRSLLAASRWQMLTSYCLLWVLAALMPRKFESLGFSVSASSALSGLIDFIRLLAFILFHYWQGWHSRSGPLLWALAGLPAGFVMVLLGGNIAVVVAGELFFGFAAGLIYYSALHNAMVVKNASVEAGGKHEGLIGTGFLLGPLAGLVGNWLVPAGFQAQFFGAMLGVAPVIVLCAGGAIRSLLGLRRCKPQATEKSQS